jgi:hypothetical protein
MILVCSHRSYQKGKKKKRFDSLSAMAIMSNLYSTRSHVCPATDVIRLSYTFYTSYYDIWYVVGYFCVYWWQQWKPRDKGQLLYSIANILDDDNLKRWTEKRSCCYGRRVAQSMNNKNPPTGAQPLYMYHPQYRPLSNLTKNISMLDVVCCYRVSLYLRCGIMGRIVNRMDNKSPSSLRWWTLSDVEKYKKKKKRRKRVE